MSSSRQAVALLLLLAFPALAGPPEPAPGPLAPAEAAEKELLPAGMSEGPMLAKLGTNAQLQVPEHAVFADAAATKRVLEEWGNLTTGRELGMVLIDGAEVIFEFDPVGHVSDDDKDSLDAAKMLESLREGQEEANTQLKALGRPELEIDRWEVEPHYEQSTHNLEWGPVVKEKKSGHESVNYNVRLLGRRGVMDVTLVVAPAKLQQTLPWFRSTLGAFKYEAGEDYAAFRSGDKVAEYGLAALVTGGAVAVAAKSGLLGKLWKLIVVAVLGAGAAIKRLFTGKGDDQARD